MSQKYKESYILAATRSENTSWEGEFKRLEQNADTWKVLRQVSRGWKAEVDKLFHFEDHVISERWDKDTPKTVLVWAAMRGHSSLLRTIIENPHTTLESFHTPVKGNGKCIWVAPAIMWATSYCAEMLLDDNRMNINIRHGIVLRRGGEPAVAAIKRKYPHADLTPWIGQDADPNNKRL